MSHAHALCAHEGRHRHAACTHKHCHCSVAKCGVSADLRSPASQGRVQRSNEQHSARKRQGKQCAPVKRVRRHSGHPNPMQCGIRVPHVPNAIAHVQMGCQTCFLLKLPNSRRASSRQRRSSDLSPSSIRTPIMSLEQRGASSGPGSAPCQQLAPPRGRTWPFRPPNLAGKGQEAFREIGFSGHKFVPRKARLGIAGEGVSQLNSTQLNSDGCLPSGGRLGRRGEMSPDSHASGPRPVDRDSGRSASWNDELW